ncbi:hypothetical protein HK097_006727 [Rhizophlyctis rosea]|uniref:Adenosine deaminase domain-containing protein n=1 Tax=Rhizophlyctis rosea TaxID=64517 RepID=A0AAD5SKD8_9FUNG|nr:hypothetical protein HK097_006727 [Rhizophlyctis rosea]
MKEKIESNAFLTEAYGSYDDLLSFCKHLPKIELHAHLNGSISKETAIQLIDRKGDPSLAQRWASTLEGWANAASKLDDFFPLFKCIYEITNNEEAITYATIQTIGEFSDDGVTYLELRSTPRPNLGTGMTKASYANAILKGIQSASKSHPSTTVRLILSLDRRESTESCLDTVDLAIQLKNKTGLVVGIDLCGPPTDGTAVVFAPAIKRAKESGLKVTLHAAEIQNIDTDTQNLLLTSPDRIGHGTFLNTHAKTHLLTSSTPIEICLTSNVLCKTVETYAQHHLQGLLFQDHPVILCTDDKGVFGSSLSEEYAIAAATFQLRKEDLYELSRRAVEFVFGSEECKRTLRNEWERFRQNNGIGKWTGWNRGV